MRVPVQGNATFLFDSMRDSFSSQLLLLPFIHSSNADDVVYELLTDANKQTNRMQDSPTPVHPDKYNIDKVAKRAEEEEKHIFSECWLNIHMINTKLIWQGTHQHKTANNNTEKKNSHARATCASHTHSPGERKRENYCEFSGYLLFTIAVGACKAHSAHTPS